MDLTMLRLIRLAALAFALVSPSTARGQDSSSISVRTFTLRWLSPKDAATLLAPYVYGPNQGVYEASHSIRAVTVRGTTATLARVDSMLRENDRQPATIVLRFQLILAVDSAAHDPAITDIDAA